MDDLISRKESIDCANAGHDADGCLGYSADDVVEVWHGRWIKDGKTGEPICSVCLKIDRMKLADWEKWKKERNG